MNKQDECVAHALTGVNDAGCQATFTFDDKIVKITLEIDRPKFTPEDEKQLMQAQLNSRVSE